LLACIWGVFILSLFVAPDQLNSAEENRLELIRQRNNRKMTLQPLPP
jgi:hypothetical protein